MTSQEVPGQDGGFSSKPKLKVTLLGSEWNSSAGGLSTFNRELAIHLAEHAEVEVTLLVPEGSCKYEEKREAKKYGVDIVDATRKPGYEPLDWLSSPPGELSIDLVIGHGVKLGRQGQFICQLSNCKWVQVVHTAPEELSKYKNYPNPISKGETKHQLEVDLCKLADLVVPVGPRLAECFSSYLRNCKKEKDVLSLTPGLFEREFGNLKQVVNDNADFKVLLLGRGDDEDFELKGYNVAAKAFTDQRLNKKPYQLIFVGASEGKQDEVREKLLQSKISEEQLTVRKFVQSRESMKDLLCEADLAIMPSKSEGFGLVALEALSASLPILVGSKSGFAKALRNIPFGCSCIVSSDDPAKWAEAIEAVRNSHQMRLQEIETLKASYGKEYSWKKQCEALVKRMWEMVDETSNENDISEGNYPVKEHEAAGNTSEHELPYGQKNEAFETKGGALFPRKDSLKRWSKPSTSGSTTDPVLPTPRETLTALPEKTNDRSIHMQPAQLKYRPSPPGVKGGAFQLCRSCYTHERCRFGRGCVYAHSNGELMEWQQEYLRKERGKRRKELQDKDEVLSMEMTTNILKGPEEDLVESLPGVDVSCNPPELSVKLLQNNGKATCQWVFNLTFQTSVVGYLRHVLLLYRYHNCYQLSEIGVCYSAKLKGFWYKLPDVDNVSRLAKVSLTVSFESSLYGSFDQCIVFDFGTKPYLVRRLNVDVQSESPPQISIVSKHVTATAIWDEHSMDVVRFVQKTGQALQAEHSSRIYSLQKQGKITAKELRRDNYKTVMHQLLFVEEGFMTNELSSYSLHRTQLHAQWSVFDDMSGIKFAADNELFGVLYLQEEDAFRPDDAAGRLLYRNVSSVWLQLADSVSNKVYEVPVEKVKNECVVVRLSSKMVSDLLLYDTCDVSVNAQFQLNRWPLCEMHAAIDRLTIAQLRRIFPEPRVPVVRGEVTIRWRWLLDKRLNDNQKEVIKQIASPEYNGPPLVVFGPFGTGKTFTLNQAVRLLVQLDKSHRILLCTHSNRAADRHVELLHDYLTKQNGTPAARPLRVYQPMRRLEATSEITRNYCLIKDDMFVLPCRDDLVKHRVVVTTLSTSQVLLDLQILHGFFTHILIDEAAQALEPKALTPIIFAGPNTKVVFTGDHMQVSPEVYSPEARRLGLQKSLAERLFDIYDKHEAQEVREYYVLFLTENYRCHPDILKFPSDNFYGEKLLARGGNSQPAHPKYGPLLFFSARGKEYKEHDNSYVNLSEVYEVVKRVKEVARNWPTRTWGPTKLSDIAVLSAYRYQVTSIP